MKPGKKRSKIDYFFTPVSLITPPLLKTTGEADQATVPNDSEESSMSDVEVCFDNVSDDDALSETSIASKSYVSTSSLNSNDEEINILRENSDDESGRRDTEHNLGTFFYICFFFFWKKYKAKLTRSHDKPEIYKNN